MSCDQNGDRVSKYDKSCHICGARLKRHFVKYDNMGLCLYINDRVQPFHLTPWHPGFTRLLHFLLQQSQMEYLSLILFVFVQWSVLKRIKLSVSDFIVSQKGSNGDRKLKFFGRNFHFTRSLCAKIHLWAKIRTSLYTH